MPSLLVIIIGIILPGLFLFGFLIFLFEALYNRGYLTERLYSGAAGDVIKSIKNDPENWELLNNSRCYYLYHKSLKFYFCEGINRIKFVNSKLAPADAYAMVSSQATTIDINTRQFNFLQEYVARLKRLAEKNEVQAQKAEISKILNNKKEAKSSPINTKVTKKVRNLGIM